MNVLETQRLEEASLQKVVVAGQGGLSRMRHETPPPEKHCQETSPPEKDCQDIFPRQSVSGNEAHDHADEERSKSSRR